MVSELGTEVIQKVLFCFVSVGPVARIIVKQDREVMVTALRGKSQMTCIEMLVMLLGRCCFKPLFIYFTGDELDN